MRVIEDIVAATDFSERGHDAVGRAAALARERQAQLTLLHVMHGPSLESLRPLFPSPADAENQIMEDARKRLEALAAAVAADSGAAPGVDVRLGRVVDEILAATAAADLLVLGARGTNPLRDMILGTTAERLLRKRRQPVLVVKHAGSQAYRRVLIPVDFSPISAESLRMAMQIAPDAMYTVLHAFDIPFEGKLWLAGVPDEQIQGYRDKARQFSLDTINHLVQEAGGDVRRFEAVAALGEASPLILDKETELGADLIVMGKQRQGLAEELLLGSVARHVLSNAGCDVLVL